MNNRLLFSKTPFLQDKKYFVQLLFLLFLVVAGMIVFSAFSVFLTHFFIGEGDFQTPHGLRLVQGLSAIGTFFIPALLFSYCKQCQCFSYSLSGRLPQKKVFFVYAFILCFTLIPCIALLIKCNELIPLPGNIAQMFADMEESSNRILEIIFSDTTWHGLFLNLLVCAIFPAICEEFFFRGTLQNFFREWFKSEHIAIWVTAFIFSTIHFQFSGFLARLVLGAYLGYLFVWSRSLWVPIVAHFFNNALSAIAAFQNSGALYDESDFYFQEGNTAITIIAMISGVLLTAIFLFYAYKQREVEAS